MRKLRGVALSKPQLDGILERAVEMSTGPSDFTVCLAVAREEFQAKHEPEGNVWVLKESK